MVSCKVCHCKINSHARACNKHKHLLKYEKKPEPRNYQRLISWLRSLHVVCQRDTEVQKRT